MNKALLFNELKPNEWNSFLLKNKYASPFQTKEFYFFLKANSQTEAFVFTLYTNNGIKALMLVTLMQEPSIKGFFSKRGIIFGGPVLADNLKADELAFFLKEVGKRMRGKAIYLETRNFFDYSGFKSSFQDCGWDYEPYLNFQLSFGGVEKDTIVSLFKYNRRREIKQSITQGAIYRLSENESEISEIYTILKDLYKTRVKLPVPTLEFFLGLYRSGILKVFVVQHEGKTIGGSC